MVTKPTWQRERWGPKEFEVNVSVASHVTCVVCSCVWSEPWLKLQRFLIWQSRQNTTNVYIQESTIRWYMYQVIFWGGIWQLWHERYHPAASSSSFRFISSHYLQSLPSSSSSHCLYQLKKNLQRGWINIWISEAKYRLDDFPES